MSWQSRADLAEAMVPEACDLAGLVHDGDRDGVKAFLTRCGLGDDAPIEAKALVVVLAAMVPVERPAADLLAWVGGGPVTVLPELRQCEDELEPDEGEIEPEGYTVQELRDANAEARALERAGREVPAEVREAALAYRRRGARLRNPRAAVPEPAATKEDHASAA